jgi:ABC-type Fe3+ transport system substrate-binding protein
VGQNFKNFPYPVVLNIPGGHSVVAVNRAPHPNARKVFLNWLLSQDGQTTISEATKINSRRADVAIMDPVTEVPKDTKTLNTQAEEFAPYRQKGNEIAREIFR